MKTVMLLALGWNLVTLAQPQSGRVSATVVVDSNDKTVLLIKNQAQVALTGFAYVLQVSDPNGNMKFGQRGWHDAALEDRLVPIVPDQQRSIDTLPDFQLKTFAAVWVDGSSFGDPVLIQQLAERKAFARAQMPTLINLLQVRQNKPTLDSLISNLQQMTANWRAEQSRTTVDPAIEIYENVIYALQNAPLSSKKGNIYDAKLRHARDILSRRQKLMTEYP